MKISKVEEVFYDTPIPVYCCTTETSNFVLASGPVVHNCGGLRQKRLPWQELLPLRGVPVNPYGKMSEAKVLANNEIQSLLTMVGFDIRNPDNWEPRVGSVLIAADPDPDGFHIASLLVGFFHKYAPNMLKNGQVRVVLTPEYMVMRKGVPHFAYTHAEGLELLKEGGDMSHIKGLGELDPEHLYKVALDPRTRRTAILECDPEQDQLGVVGLLGENADDRKRLLGFDVE